MRASEREREMIYLRQREHRDRCHRCRPRSPPPTKLYYLPVLLNRLIVEREKKWYWSMIIYVIIRPRCYRKTVFNKNFIWTNGIGAHFQPSELPPRNTQGARPEINGSIVADRFLRVQTVRGKFASPVFIVALRFARRTRESPRPNGAEANPLAASHRVPTFTKNIEEIRTRNCECGVRPLVVFIFLPPVTQFFIWKKHVSFSSGSIEPPSRSLSLHIDPFVPGHSVYTYTCSV